MSPTPTPPDPAPLLATARAAADAAARVHRRWLDRGPLPEARQKGRADFVSKVDLESEAAALEVIRERYPDAAILAEESGRSGMAVDDGTPLWVIDPLDGTTNFLHRHPDFCASVGVLMEGRPVVGAVTRASTGERWWAAPGAGAWRNAPALGVEEERIRVSQLDDLEGALVGTGFPFKLPRALPRYLAQLERVLPSCSGIRRGGSAALDLCYLAQGSLDVFWEIHLSPWDIAGGLAILAQAGGCWSEIDGRPLVVERGGSVLAANGPALRSALRALL